MVISANGNISVIVDTGKNEERTNPDFTKKEVGKNMHMGQVIKNIKVPTGNIMIIQGDNGLLELVSIGDYGKEKNIKADFMGLSRDIERIQHSETLPLTEKWVIMISSQYGCSMNCKFCDVPRVGPGINATWDDMVLQIIAGLNLHPEINYTERLNIHFARMGEPTWNPEVLKCAEFLPDTLYPYIGDSLIHPIISTMMPKRNKDLEKFLVAWMGIKNDIYLGNAGLQLSINSTSDKEREEMFSGNSLSLAEISEIGKRLPFPKDRKITLNFAVAGYEVDAEKLRSLFDPEKFIVKLTPMHKTRAATENDIETEGDYTTLHPYSDIEEKLKAVGFDVLVFLASEDEDLGRITCGNAILSGTMPEINQ